VKEKSINRAKAQLEKLLSALDQAPQIKQAS